MIVMSNFYNRVKEVQESTKIRKIVVTNIKETLPPILRFLFTLTKEKKSGFRVELDEIINEDKTTPNTSDIRRKELLMEIFKHLWLTDNYMDAENSLVNALVTCKDFTW